MQHSHWRSQSHLSRVLAAIERFLIGAGFDRMPWLVIAFGAGIVAWFGLTGPWQWLTLVTLCLATVAMALMWRDHAEQFVYLRQAVVLVPLAVAAGCLLIWAKSELVGQPPIEKPMIAWMDGRVIDRQDRPSQRRVRLVLEARLPGGEGAVRVRLNLPEALDQEAIEPGSVLRLRARLMPPAPPMLPGGYNFARTAWFSGLAATGTVIAPVQVLKDGSDQGGLKAIQIALSRHIRSQLDGSSGALAATLASGDRGSIAIEDDQAMRDSGLAHLLSISGLHVSALIALAYLVALRLLALWPWLTLRVRLPLAAAACGAFSGVFYTLLTGAEVPTVRSCIGSLLVLAAVALGRDALSTRMLAIVAFLVLLLWPEALIGPSFQFSFAAVLAIVALSQSAPIRQFMSARDESWLKRGARNLAMIFLTGLLIEFALMPIGLYHFHKAGFYGAFANVIAIPLTTVVIMPLIAGSLLLDVVGLGAPGWWLVDQALKALLGLAHWVSAQPGAVTRMPAIGSASFLLFVAGGLWLALWRGRMRLLGLIPSVIGALSLTTLQPPDVLISRDGRHIGITEPISGDLLILRDGKSSFAKDNLTEISGMNGATRLLSDWEGARCNKDFCSVAIERNGRTWFLLISRGTDYVPERDLAAACERSDIAISDRWLPASCRPRWLKADRELLASEGGLSIDLGDGSVRSVAQSQGAHGWNQLQAR